MGFKLWLLKLITGSRLKALLIVGRDFLKAGRNVTALSYFRNAVKEYPERPEGYQGMADAYKAMGMRPESLREQTIADSLKTLAGSPDNLEARLSLSRALMEKSLNGLAAAQIDYARKRAPRHLEVAQLAAKIYTSNRNYLKAAGALEDMLLRDPLNAEYYERLAYCYQQGKRTGEAMKAASIGQALKLVQNDPANVPLVDTAVRQFQNTGQRHTALMMVEKCLQGNASVAGLHRLRGELLLEERNNAEAIASLRKAVEIDPIDLKAHRFLSTAYNADGRHEQSLHHQSLAETMEQAKSSGDPVATEMAMVRLLLEAGKVDRALEKAQKMVSDYNEDWRGPFMVGMVYKHQEQFDEAMEWVKRARRLNVNAAEPHLEMGWLHSQAGLVLEAIGEARQAVALARKNPEIRRGLAAILRAHGYSSQAQSEEELAEVIARDHQ